VHAKPITTSVSSAVRKSSDRTWLKWHEKVRSLHYARDRRCWVCDLFSARFRPVYRQFFWLFVIDCVLLTYAGGRPPAGVWLVMSRFGAAYYFLFFLLVMPLVGIFEKTLLLFFLKAGSLTFGSGLVIVPFLEQGLVQQYNWLDERQFLIAVAIGMISPGPVVITATFVGYLVAGFWGSLVSTVGIFFPSFILVLVVAPLLARHRTNPNVQGFVKGAYAAAIGTILGACVLLGKIAIGDWLTALIGVGSLAVLFRWKVSNPMLIAATAVLGLIAFPILEPNWVMVK